MVEAKPESPPAEEEADPSKSIYHTDEVEEKTTERVTNS